MHECERVFSDRLINNTEAARFNDILVECCKRNFADVDQEAVLEKPLIFTSFASQQDTCLAISDLGSLNATLEAKLAEYNESNPIMELVLFEQAMEHVCRIARIIESPSGNAMLVGVGGSGKQSL